ncbi:PREDICTED: cation/H(+) antiporter 3-like [Ipomoea nil]|uniref:cation/H(+) antiporter 3-like n=1 Tax=Ipomoea nil TaxID=35883 RepID=UPI00090170C8|nr:PREDICTED: cation/H(+) antiporter 3-like [Ipomoea nil]
MEDPGGTHDKCLVKTKVHSTGLWGRDIDGMDYRFVTYSLPRLFLQLCIMFGLTQALHLFFLKRFRLPRIISELLAGIILGPTLIGRFDWIKTNMIPMYEGQYVDLLSKIGFLLFIFLSGVKMDPGMVPRSGAKAWTIGIPSVLLPYVILKYLSRKVLNDHVWTHIHRYRHPAIQNTLGIQSFYSFPVTAVLLVDLKIINTELGRLALATGLICDLFSNLVSTIIANISVGVMSAMPLVSVHSFALSSGLILFLVVTVRPLSAMIIRRTPEGEAVDTFHVLFMCFAALLATVLADNVGMNFHYGPFILGLLVPDGPPLGSAVVDKLDTLVSGLFAPLLVTYSGTKIDLLNLFDLRFLGVVWITVMVCYVIKCVAIFLPALACRVPLRDAAALAFILSTQGVVQISSYHNSLVNQTYDTETFSMLTVAALVTAAVSHIMVASLHDYSRAYCGYERRNIEHLSKTSELRLVTCFHRLEDAVAARKLLEVSFSSKETPLVIYSLHLAELVGRVTPLLIDHQLGQMKTSAAAAASPAANSRSQKLVAVLRSFAQQHCNEFVTLNFFTAISLPKFMHDDVSALAFDKLASMIILPFHRKWNHLGRLIVDSSSMRLLNRTLLDLAPCSVGILIDREKRRMHRRSPSSSSYHVAVIFMGGADDREALCYAKRMSNTPGVQLTVVRFVPADHNAEKTQWDAVLDSEVLKEVRHLAQSNDTKVCYKEETVKDGAETACTVHEMEHVFDLILVGRRHETNLPQLFGLSQWNDIPELGPLGDMLAIQHIRSPVSVLVVQQQYVKNK